MSFSPLKIDWSGSLLGNTKICFLVFFVALQLSFSSPLAAQPADSHPIVVMVSIQPQEWLVEQIGGERVEVAPVRARGDLSERPRVEYLLSTLRRALCEYRSGWKSVTPHAVKISIRISG